MHYASLRYIPINVFIVTDGKKNFLWFLCTKRIFYKPLLHDFCFPLIFEIQPNTGSYRLPSHKSGAHRNFFPWSILILKLKSLPNVDPGPRYSTKGYWLYTVRLFQHIMLVNFDYIFYHQYCLCYRAYFGHTLFFYYTGELKILFNLIGKKIWY